MVGDDSLMTPREVANFFKVTPQAIYKMKERGILKPANISGLASVRFHRADVMALVDNKRTRRSKNKVAA